MIERNKYLEIIIRTKNNGFPKVITGIRRCGKSYFLKEIYKEYLLKHDVPENNILIIELDDDTNIKFRNPIELGMYIRSYCKEKKIVMCLLMKFN